jgi:cell division protein FtsA
VTRPQISVGLDAGTTKVCVVAAETGARGTRILGVGVSASSGLRKGVVTNMDAAVDSIKKALKEAEASSGIRIRSAAVGISGAHVKGFDSSGAVGIKEREVTEADRERALDSAKAVYIPLDREVLHVMPTEFVLDGQEGITDPRGMSGVRLEARVHIITCAASPMQNLIRCCERSGLEVAEVIFSPIASARSVLTREEKEFGVLLVDIGGGATDIALFKDGAVRKVSSFGMGGSHITSDLAVGLRVNLAEAERLKKAEGSAIAGMVGASEETRVTQPDGEADVVPRRYLAEIIQPRCEEILELVKEEIKKDSACEALACGAVVTGGTSLLRGFERIAAAMLGLSVRTGVPLGLSSSDPTVRTPFFATAVGLVSAQGYTVSAGTADTEAPFSITEKMKEWTKDVFRYAENLKFYNRKEGNELCLKSKK